MASEGMEIPKDVQTEEKPEKSSTPEKKISITEVRAVMAEKVPCRKNAGNQTVIERVRCG